MLRIQVLLSMLCAVLAVAAALVKPLPARGDDAPAPTPTPDTPASTIPPPQPLFVAEAPITAAAARKRAFRTPQLHLPFGTRVVDYAKHFLGTRYVYGGSSPRTGFDCSGLVRYVYAHFGLSLPHSSFAQFNLGRRVSRRSLRPGDLLFFDGLGHVGMYIGNGRFIHAPHTGTRVRIEVFSGWYSSRFDGARRLRAA
jgi:cell wall-associated NlpC family hydrolase